MKRNVAKIAIGAICIALSSFVLSLFTIRVNEALQIGFTELPIIFSGALLGPVYGSVIGFVVDLLRMIKFSYAPSLFTLAPIVLGMVPGISLIVFKQRISYKFPILIITVFVAMTLRTLITSLALYYVQGLTFQGILITLPIKMLANVIETVIYALILYVILPAATTIFNEKLRYK